MQKKQAALLFNFVISAHTPPFRDIFEKIRGVNLLFFKYPIEKKTFLLEKTKNFPPSAKNKGRGHFTLYVLIGDHKL